MENDQELRLIANRLATARDYTDIFPDEASMRDVYRKLARVIHPDRWGTQAHHDTATVAYQQLSGFYAQAQKAVESQHFGRPEIIIRGKAGAHVVRDRLGNGDICTLYRTESTLDIGKEVGLLKLARSPKDSDLLAAEATALKTLHATPHTLTRHYPKLLDRFLYQPSRGTRRRANVLEWHPGMNLAQLRKVFPGGVDPLHGAWIWRRLLMALGYAHEQGVVHGAVIPEHVLVHPVTHAVILVDWCYSRMANDQGQYPPIAAMAGGIHRQAIYPREVKDKQTPNPSTDLFMAARTMDWMLCSDQAYNRAPVPMRAYFNGCMLHQSVRPSDAWELLREFDDLLEHLGEPYWPRRYRELAVPTGAA